MVAQPYIIPGQGNISHQNNMSSHIELCDVHGLRRMSYILTSVADFIPSTIFIHYSYLTMRIPENTERRSHHLPKM
jgi:hypothetical protein